MPARDKLTLLAALPEKIDPSKQALSLADCRRPDMPLIYVNQGFEKLTGYTSKEAIGRNCRFLQGADTDAIARDSIGDAITLGKPLIVDLLNYRKDGTTFWNRLSIRPVKSADGDVTHYIGIQSDISKMKALEEQLYGFALELAGGKDRARSI